MPDKRPSDHDPSVLADEMDRQMEEEMVSDSSDALANAMEKMPKKAKKEIGGDWIRWLPLCYNQSIK